MAKEEVKVGGKNW